jgi:hypothetical protein
MKDGKRGVRQGTWVVTGLAESCFGSWRGCTVDNILSATLAEVLLKKK